MIQWQQPPSFGTNWDWGLVIRHVGTVHIAAVTTWNCLPIRWGTTSLQPHHVVSPYSHDAWQTDQQRSASCLDICCATSSAMSTLKLTNAGRSPKSHSVILFNNANTDICTMKSFEDINSSSWLPIIWISCICFCLTSVHIISLGRRQSTALVLTQEKCLKEANSKVHVGKHSFNTFPIWNGLKQIDFLWSLLFNSALEYIIRKVQTSKGFQWHLTQELMF